MGNVKVSTRGLNAWKMGGVLRGTHASLWKELKLMAMAIHCIGDAHLIKEVSIQPCQCKLMSITADNRWIVPYSPVLSRSYECHINVEYCSSVKAIQYICKYCNKGPDAARFKLRDRDTPR